MADLRVRVYDVKFGDAILVTVPGASPGDPAKHLLIDVGNAPFKEGSDKSVYLPIVRSVVRELAGEPLHVYLSTHEHMDHVQGLLHASKELPYDLGATLAVEKVWLTASADPAYYDDQKHPDARKKLEFRDRLYLGLERAELRHGRSALPSRLEAMAANNNPRSTAECVAYVRNLSADVTYLSRGVTPSHALPGVQIRILAPEEDASVYYRRPEPHHAAPSSPVGDELADTPEGRLPAAPAGVDATTFRVLWEVFRSGPLTDALLEIDKAANNTSVVFVLEWSGWKLLFAGDAEERSWEIMHARGVLEPVHMIKVSHHGSHNGTPSAGILDAVLPPQHHGPPRIAVVSTCPNTYSGIPHEPTDDELRARCAKFLKTTDAGLSVDPVTGARYFDLLFSAEGP